MASSDSVTTKTSGATSHAPWTPPIPITAPMTGILRILKSPNSDNPLEVGYLEGCDHPTVVNGLCVVCGAPVKDTTPKFDPDTDNVDNATTESKNNQQRITVAGGVTMTVSEREGMRLAREDTQRLQKLKKLSLVLDLDHTLVHATSDTRARQYAQSETDVRSLVLPLVLDNQTQVLVTHYVKLRPHVKEFLQDAHEFYEVGVYTAGTRQYAEQITMLLARHVIGAEYDAPELEEMRLKIARLEKAVEQKKDANDAAPTKSNNDGDSKPLAGTKRRKVTFGEPAAHEKTDEIEPEEELIALKEKFDKALAVEKEAAELRQKIFGGRLVSRTDVGDLGRDVKSLKRMFPCGGSMAVVVDDREDVWANAVDNDDSVRKGEPPHNLLMCKPYHWKPFLGFADVNNSAGEDLSGADIEKDEEDRQLLWTLDVLKRLHFEYYAKGDRLGNGKTVPQLIAEMRKIVLRGSCLLLSGLVPLHRQTAGDHIQRPRPQFVRHSENLGAKLLSQVEPILTHVVAAKDGTEKVLAARRKVAGCVVVKPSWLMECAWTLSKRDVKNHLLTASAAMASSKATSTAPSDDPSNTETPSMGDQVPSKPVFELIPEKKKIDDDIGDAYEPDNGVPDPASASNADDEEQEEDVDDEDEDFEAAFAMEMEDGDD